MAETPSDPGTPSDESCPVCKSSRYLNPGITFLIEPTCYHKMCTSCVDRLFSGGPALCPVAGCNARLRANRFRSQVFTSIAVEREVDVRKRVAKVFNKRQEDFPTLQEWNDYLESVEEMTFELLEGSEGAEERLKGYEEANKEAIRVNKERERLEKERFRAEEEARMEEIRVARELKKLEEEEEKRELEESKIAQLRALERGEDVEAIKAQFQKRREQRRNDLKSEMERIRGIREGREMALESLRLDDQKEEEEEEWEPLGKGVKEDERWVRQDKWERVGWIDDFVSKPAVSAGGYGREEWFERVMNEAFEGLTVFIGEDQQDDLGRTDVMMVGA